MIFDSNFQFQDALGYINTCCDFTHKDGRISTPFFSKIFFVLLILIYIAVVYGLIYYYRKYKYFGISDAVILVTSIMLVLGVLLNFCIITNKVIDYKNNLIYCELLIFNFLICRYGNINGVDIAAVGNNMTLHHVKRGIRYTYYTSILLNDGTLKDFFDFGSRYSAAYNLAIVLANFFHKPLTVAGKEQQLTVSAGVRGYRLSASRLNLIEFEYNYQIKTVITLFIIITVTLLLCIIK